MSADRPGTDSFAAWPLPKARRRCVDRARPRQQQQLEAVGQEDGGLPPEVNDTIWSIASAVTGRCRPWGPFWPARRRRLPTARGSMVPLIEILYRCRPMPVRGAAVRAAGRRAVCWARPVRVVLCERGQDAQLHSPGLACPVLSPPCRSLRGPGGNRLVKKLEKPAGRGGNHLLSSASEAVFLVPRFRCLPLPGYSAGAAARRPAKGAGGGGPAQPRR